MSIINRNNTENYFDRRNNLWIPHSTFPMDFATRGCRKLGSRVLFTIPRVQDVKFLERKNDTYNYNVTIVDTDPVPNVVIKKHVDTLSSSNFIPNMTNVPKMDGFKILGACFISFIGGYVIGSQS